jgi:hypothetical protein
VAKVSSDSIPQSGTTSENPYITLEGGWEPWFAWYPVRLYMTGRFCWLRRIYRRCVAKAGIKSCDYSDQPDEFPA